MIIELCICFVVNKGGKFILELGDVFLFFLVFLGYYVEMVVIMVMVSIFFIVFFIDFLVCVRTF